MANLITLTRLLLLAGLVAIAYRAAPTWQIVHLPLVAVVFLMDGLDGWVARARNETSVFGSIFDIAADRVVEIVLWLVLADLGAVPVWVPIVFIVRGNIVDAIRYAGISRGETAFGMMQRPWARFLVSGRFLRTVYAILKSWTFALLLILPALAALAPEWWQTAGATVTAIAIGMTWATVFICILRGVPVVAEFLSDRRVFARDDDALAGAG